MESEEFYDSLDDDSSYESVEIEPLLKSDKFRKYQYVPLVQIESHGKISNKQVQTSGEDSSIIEDIIPFYSKNSSKSAIDLISSKGNSESGTHGNKSIKKLRRKKSKIPIIDYKKSTSTSYLQIFRSKKGGDSNEDLLMDSSRATCSELSLKSYTTCEDLDMNYVKSLDFSDSDSIDSGFKHRPGEPHFSLSIASLDSKIYSVSQHNILIMPIKTKRKNTRLITNAMPEMGSLGPEIPQEKLELLMKRQQYGQKVSRINKIKMVEKKLLRNLEQEIKECNKII